MITGVFGLPGDGKSYYMMIVLEEIITKTTLPIVTNIDVFTGEIAQCLHDKYGKSFDVHSRFRFITKAQSKTFWRYRHGYELQASGEGKNQTTNYDTMREDDPGCAYFIDEVHISFNARMWAQTGADALEYTSQHRKLGDELWLISQRPAQVDSQMRGLCAVYIAMKNLSHRNLKLGPFSFNFPRSLAAMCTPTECKPGTKPDVVMWENTFKVDPKYYGSWYNTAAGVGMKGHGKADKDGPRKKGLSVYWLYGAAVVFILAACSLPFLARKGVVVGMESRISAAAVSLPPPSPLFGFQVKPKAADDCCGFGFSDDSAPLDLSNPRSFSVSSSGYVRIVTRLGKHVTTSDGVVLLGREGYQFKGRTYPMP
jgi:hypothetical protein